LLWHCKKIRGGAIEDELHDPDIDELLSLSEDARDTEKYISKK